MVAALCLVACGSRTLTSGSSGSADEGGGESGAESGTPPEEEPPELPPELADVGSERRPELAVSVAGGTLFRVWLDGSEPVPIIEGGGSSWSPDGERLAFAWRDGSSGGIAVADADGANPTHLTDLDEGDWWPLWSPDGNWIAFIRRNGGPEAGMYVVQPSGWKRASNCAGSQPRTARSRGAVCRRERCDGVLSYPLMVRAFLDHDLAFLEDRFHSGSGSPAKNASWDGCSSPIFS